MRLSPEFTTRHFTYLRNVNQRVSSIHSRNWPRPMPLERLIWDADAVFGPQANWRDAPNVTREIRAVLEQTEALICRRLQAFGKGQGRYGLIHADMRLAG